jgi:hypothetical protein
METRLGLPSPQSNLRLLDKLPICYGVHNFPTSKLSLL